MHTRWLISGSAAVAVATTLAVGQIRVVNWNLAELRGEVSAIEAVIEALDGDDAGGFASPVTILTVQEADNLTYNTLLSSLGPEWSAATYTNSNEDPYGGAQACFYHAATVTEDPSGHDDTYVEAGRRADRWKFSLNGHTDPPVEFYVYSAHLKAGNNSSSEADRLTGAERIVANMGEVPSDSRIIVTGDMNFYDNGEAGYQAFLAGGLIDPLGSGDWGGAGNTLKHSQSPRTIQSGGLANGGLDDRFDLHLHTPQMTGTGGLTMIAGTYRAVGNDGNHYNQAINDGNNTYWPDDVAGSNSLADALHDASDHLPVAVDYRIPAVLDASFEGCDLGTVIEGADIECTLTIGNAAAPTHDVGAAALNWSLAGTGVLASNTDSGSLGAGDGTALNIAVDTSSAGAVSGTLDVEADDVLTQHAPGSMAIEGHVLRHANPSFSSTSDNNFYVYMIEVDADSGDVPVPIQFWNYQWDADQSRLDIDDVSVAELPLQFGGGTWNNVGPFPISMPFTVATDGWAAGNYVRTVTITTSDQDLPGEASQSLHATFNITVRQPEPQCVGDVNGDGVTDISDLLDLLAAYGTTDPTYDLEPDGIVDVSDLLLLLGDYGCS
jgi:hypothetical protein